MSDNDAAKGQELLEQRGPGGERVYDHVSKDPATGQWLARRADDHRVVERPS
jgi:hypothetical protein